MAHDKNRHDRTNLRIQTLSDRPALLKHTKGQELKAPTLIDQTNSVDGVSEPFHDGTAENSSDKKTRPRGSSITFDSQVTLDSGHVLPIDQALPKPEVPTQPRGRAVQHNDLSPGSGHGPLRSRTHSESDRYKYDPVTGEPLTSPGMRREDRFYHTGEPRFPFLQSTVDALASSENTNIIEQSASIASHSTLSSRLDPMNTPDIAGEYISSPQELSSSVPFPMFASPPRTGIISPFAPRSLTSRSNSSRRTLRNSSYRSNSSSLSPAGAFLSKWSREETVPVIEPDDEGQEIGDHSEYIIGRKIGHGGFSIVKEVFTIENDVRVRRAVKIVRKQIIGKSSHDNDLAQEEFEHEVSVWRYLNHPYILRLLAVYDSPFATFCITELTEGGTLFDLLKIHRRRTLSPKISPKSSRNEHTGVKNAPVTGISNHLTKRYLYQLASAIRYLHQDVRIVHRDIKLENCLLDTGDPTYTKDTGANLLLCDFGMSDFISREDRDDSSSTLSTSDRTDLSPLEHDQHHGIIGPSELSTCVVGSLEYASPEVVKARAPMYEPSADMWAFGVVAYALMTGERPFAHAFQPTVQMRILKGDWNAKAIAQAFEAATGNGQQQQHANGVSGAEAALELVKGCLEMDPDLRWTIADVIGCRFLEGCAAVYEPDLEA